MIAFEPFRSSVPKLPYISNTPHLQVYPTVVRDGHQPVPRFVINVRSAFGSGIQDSPSFYLDECFQPIVIICLAQENRLCMTEFTTASVTSSATHRLYG